MRESVNDHPLRRSGAVPRRRAGAVLPVTAALLLGSAGLIPALYPSSAQAVTPVPTPAPKPAAKTASAKGKPTTAKTAARDAKPAPTPSARPTVSPSAKVTAASAAGGMALAASPSFSGSLSALKTATDLIDKGQSAQALAMADQMRDPGAQALVRWLALRVTARDVGFDRAVAILQAHPTLPTPIVLRRRLEYLLYVENKDPQTILAFFSPSRRPIPAKARSRWHARCSPPATRRRARPGCAMPGRKTHSTPTPKPPSWWSSAAC
ncbi:hypothetical protein ACFSKM_12585 [Ancylobacter dichloromethanicus]